MPSRSPLSSPTSDVDHPHLINHRPLSEYEPSVVTIPDTHTHTNKQTQTSSNEELYPIHPQDYAIPTFPNPPLTSNKKNSPIYPPYLNSKTYYMTKIFTSLWSLIVSYIVQCWTSINLTVSSWDSMITHKWKRSKDPPSLGLYTPYIKWRRLPSWKHSKKHHKNMEEELFVTDVTT